MGEIAVEAMNPRGYSAAVSIELTGTEEEQLRELAARTGRDVRLLAQEAIRQYVEALAIADLDPGQVAETQSALVAELPGISDWKVGLE
jgi:predicted transcriptional regulator